MGHHTEQGVRFDLDGAFVDEFTTTGVANGLGHFWDSIGRFYISVYGNGGTGTVQRFAADGALLDIFIDSSILQGPTDLWQDDNGDVLVQDWTTGAVLRFDSTGAFLSTYISGLSNPEGHAFLPNGDLLMGDWGEDAVHRLGASGNSLGYFTSGNGLTDPNCVRVREVPLTGVSEFAGGVAALRVAPNVGAGPFEVLLEEPLASDARMVVLDATGCMVERVPLAGPANGSSRVRWHPDDGLAPGSYHIVLHHGAMRWHARITLVE
ncbi:MAG: hypothetical protein IPF41_09585 [Flavobacteriales bacterium]|nr:hypothetical protein [Flavobacteriales bacterium]